MTRKFTGWHMLGLMIAFYAVIIGVNFTMASFATRTFGGTVVDNSYVASQQFNDWLAKARAQEALGWEVRAAVDGGAVAVAARTAGEALRGARVTGVAAHPLGRLPKVPMTFIEAAPGRYVAAHALAPGRWRLHITVARGGRTAQFVEEIFP